MKTIILCSYEYRKKEHLFEVFDGRRKHILEVPEKVPRDEVEEMVKHSRDLKLLLAIICAEHQVEFKPPTLDQILDRQIRRMELDQEGLVEISYRYYNLPVYGNVVLTQKQLSATI